MPGGDIDYRGFRTRTFNAGDIIIRRGDTPNCAYIVQDGEVIIACGQGPSRHHLSMVRPGGIFGEIAAIDGKPSVIEAIATIDTACLVVPLELLNEKIANADPFLRALLRILGRNLRTVIKDLDQRDGPQLADIPIDDALDSDDIGTTKQVDMHQQRIEGV